MDRSHDNENLELLPRGTFCQRPRIKASEQCEVIILYKEIYGGMKA